MRLSSRPNSKGLVDGFAFVRQLSFAGTPSSGGGDALVDCVVERRRRCEKVTDASALLYTPRFFIGAAQRPTRGELELFGQRTHEGRMVAVRDTETQRRLSQCCVVHSNFFALSEFASSSSDEGRDVSFKASVAVPPWRARGPPHALLHSAAHAPQRELFSFRSFIAPCVTLAADITLFR